MPHARNRTLEKQVNPLTLLARALGPKVCAFEVPHVLVLVRLYILDRAMGTQPTKVHKHWRGSHCALQQDLVLPASLVAASCKPPVLLQSSTVRQPVAVVPVAAVSYALAAPAVPPVPPNAPPNESPVAPRADTSTGEPLLSLGV